MSSSRSLASLPDIVLREVLSYLLVDTPRAPLRTAILETCTTLCDLGRPLLYRVVDLLDMPSLYLARYITTLFGWDGGLLTDGGRIPGLAQSVVELRVGGPSVIIGSFYHSDDTFVLGSVDLPRCTRLVYEGAMPLPSTLRSILPRLPIVDLVIKYHPRRGFSVPIRFDGARSLASHLGMSVQPWKDLSRVTYEGLILWDPSPFLFQAHGDPHLRLPLAEWSFKTLVVDLIEWPDKLISALLRHPPQTEPFLKNVARIELRVGPQEESEIRVSLQSIEVRKPSDPVSERLLPLIVLVGPDGKERKLIE